MTRPLPVGGRALRLPLVLSPMVDVTDAAFRSLARDAGADVTCSEMISAAGLTHGSRGAWELVRPWPGESPYGVQFMTGDPGEMAQAVRDLAHHERVDFVDVNLGCPAPNILRSCAGGFLLRDPQKAGAVVRAAAEAAQEVGIPAVSVKMRLGPDEGRLTYLDVAREAEAAGAAWVTLHARTVAQGYAGQADWSHIARLRDGVSVPVVGNGDLRTPADVVAMREQTGCDGFFIARAAMADPTVFRRMRAVLEGRGDPGPGTPEDRLLLLAEYLRRAPEAGVASIGDLRRQAMRLVTGLPEARRARLEVQGCQDLAQLQGWVESRLAGAPPVTRSSGG